MPTWKRCPCGHGTYSIEPAGDTTIRQSEACEWHDAIGRLVYAATWILDSRGHLETLDAVAAVLREHARQRKATQDAIRDGERDARDASRKGREDGYTQARREQEW